jgi:hypothetical protein
MVGKIASLRQPKRRAWRDLTTACVILRDVFLCLARYVTHNSGAGTEEKAVTKISYPMVPLRRARIKTRTVPSHVA